LRFAKFVPRKLAGFDSDSEGSKTRKCMCCGGVIEDLVAMFIRKCCWLTLVYFGLWESNNLNNK